MDEVGGAQKIEKGVLAAAWDPSRWGEALQIIAEEFKATGSGLVPISGNALRGASSPATEELFHFHDMGGWRDRNDRRRLGTQMFLRDGVVIDQDFITPDEILHSPYYNECLGKMGFRWAGAIKLQSDGDAWCIAIQRKIAEGPFNANERLRLAHLKDRLAPASMLAVEVSRIKLKSLSDFLDTLGKPSLFLNRAGEITGLNQRAETLLRSDDLLRNRRLKFPDRAGAETFESAWRMILEPRSERYGFGPIMLGRKGKRPLLLSLLCLDFCDLNPLHSARIIVMISDLDERRPAVGEQLRLVFGLTGAEGRLAETLSDGGTIAAAAEKLGVTRETAKSQLKSIYTKTETNRQAELVALLARIIQVRQ